MKNIIIKIRLFLIAIILLVQFSASIAQVPVNGYYRKNGTYVQPHYRSSPNSTKMDNWSTKGNVNPYTGEKGTKKVYDNYPSFFNQINKEKDLYTSDLSFDIGYQTGVNFQRNKQISNSNINTLFESQGVFCFLSVSEITFVGLEFGRRNDFDYSYFIYSIGYKGLHLGMGTDFYDSYYETNGTTIIKEDNLLYSIDYMFTWKDLCVKSGFHFSKVDERQLNIGLGFRFQ
jgi:hypothetical protein